MLLKTNYIPPKEVIFEYTAVASGAFSISLVLSPIQIALGVKLFVNGLMQQTTSFTADGTSIIIPSDLNIIATDIIQILYYEAL